MVGSVLISMVVWIVLCGMLMYFLLKEKMLFYSFVFLLDLSLVM